MSFMAANETTGSPCGRPRGRGPLGGDKGSHDRGSEDVASASTSTRSKGDKRCYVHNGIK